MGMGSIIKTVDSVGFAIGNLKPNLKNALDRYDAEIEKLEMKSAAGTPISHEAIEEIKSKIPDIDQALKEYSSSLEKFNMLSRTELKIQ